MRYLLTLFLLLVVCRTSSAELVLYSIDVAADELLHVDASDGSVVGSVSLNFNFGDTSLAFDTARQQLMAIDATVDRLLSIDVSTGNVTQLNLLGRLQVNGLTYDQTLDRLLAIDNITDELIEIDPVTAQTNVIGSLGIQPTDFFTGLELANGSLYAVDNNTNPGTYTVDLNTGTATLVGRMDLGSTVQSSGLAYDSGLDVFYVADNAGDRLLRVNRANGDGLVIGPFGISAVQGMASVGTSIPEPSGASLFLVLLFGLARRKRRN